MRQVFVSDLHLSDGTIGSSVSEADLIRYLLMPVAAAAPVRVILLGDIFELLRSSSWKGAIDPWTGLNEGFKNFPKPARECVELVTANILARYPEFARQWKDLVTAGKVEPVFVPGNHDFMLQLSPSARNQVRQFFALPASGKPFKKYYYDKDSAIYAVHGNQYDAVNLHDDQAGQWAFGDAIVLKLVNGFICSACVNLGQSMDSPDTPLAQALQDLDNVEPLTDLPLYFRYIMEEHLSNSADVGELLSSWSKAVDGLLAVPHFHAPENTTPWVLRKGLEASKNQGLSKLASKLAMQLSKVTDAERGEQKYGVELDKVSELNLKPARVFIYGHTHRPGITALPSPSDNPRYVINTGCWRRVVHRVHGTNDFRALQVHSMLWVEQDKEGKPHYRLERREEVV
jgi:UDP-2,3-diacylglucosamine pyrophosphatase LpxH